MRRVRRFHSLIIAHDADAPAEALLIIGTISADALFPRELKPAAAPGRLAATPVHRSHRAMEVRRAPQSILFRCPVTGEPLRAGGRTLSPFRYLAQGLYTSMVAKVVRPFFNYPYNTRAER